MSSTALNIDLDSYSLDFNDDLEIDDEGFEVKPLADPSLDIKEDLADILQDPESFEFSGTFACSQRYRSENSSNPCLNIAGLGPIGLPLNEREAKVLISHCQPHLPAPDGIWELDATKITFENPQWNAWIVSTVLPCIIQGLGVAGSGRLEFEKLVVHEPGSEELQYTDSSRGPFMFGSVTIVLPSAFKGCGIELTHDGQSKNLNFSHQANLHTSIVASYLGVLQTLAPVQSGYRLSLSYRLTQPLSQSLPQLPDMNGAIHRLRHVLASWRQNSDDHQPALGYLLQNTYAASTFSAKILHGTDKHVLTHLLPLARELKFNLHLVHVVLSSSGSIDRDPDDRYSYRRYGRCGWDEDEDDDFDEADYSLEDANETTNELSVRQIFDLNGMPKQIPDLDLDIDDILTDLREQEEDSCDYDKDYDSVTITKKWTGTLILISPKSKLHETIGDVFDFASKTLEASHSTTPSSQESKLVDALVECCAQRKTTATEGSLKRAAGVLRECADRWNNVDLFIRSVYACGVNANLALLSSAGFVSAYQAFPWDRLEGFFSDAINNGNSNLLRFELINELAQAAHGDATVEQWCKERRDCVLRSLRPVDAKQLDSLFITLKDTEPLFFHDVILPQLKVQPYDQTFWVALVKKLSDPSTACYHSNLEDLLQYIIQKAPAFPMTAQPSGYPYHYARKDTGAIMNLLNICIDAKKIQLCSVIFNKMATASPVPNPSPTSPKPLEFYTALIPLINQLLQSKIELNPYLHIFGPFYDKAIALMLEAGNLDKAILSIALKRSPAALTLLKDFLTPVRVQQYAKSTILRSLAETVFELRLNLFDELSQRLYYHIMGTAVQGVITGHDFKARPSPYHIYHSNNSTPPLLDLIQFTFRVGVGPVFLEVILRRVLSCVTAAEYPAHLTNVLIPLLTPLKTFLVQNKLDWTVEPYASFFRNVVASFSRTFLNQALSSSAAVPDSLQRIGCSGSCLHCPDLKQFFLSEKKTVQFRFHQNIRSHIEQQLRIAGASASGVQTTTIRTGSPHTLVVTKPDNMTAHGALLANREKGKRLVASLGDAATQMKILREDYQWIHGTTLGTCLPPSQNVAVLTSATNKRPAAPSAAAEAKKPRLG
ncbi:hypothetical protein C8J56DRAFT_1157949 [Mycena floridula]|nr:hypothetical protein C8J56DRAFT_1157949 [Mycena floridula]